MGKSSERIALDQAQMEAFCDCVSSYTRELNEAVDKMQVVGAYFLDTENIDGKATEDVIGAIKKAAQATNHLKTKTDALDTVAKKVREAMGISISSSKKSFAETKAVLDQNVVKIKNLSAK